MQAFFAFLVSIGVALGTQPLSTSTVFSDHMVLQQGKPVAVWGQGTKGSTVEVTFMDQTKQTTVSDEGLWRVDLDPMPVVSEGQTLTIKSSKGEKLEYNDVLVGEVWFCSGQSNMEMGLGAVENGEEEIKNATDPMIRVFEPKVRARYLVATDIDATWKVCSPEVVREGAFNGFGAIAYFFAQRLRAELKVPVGVINSSWGGTPIRAYIPPEIFDEYPEIKGNSDTFYKERKDYLDRARWFVQNSQNWINDLKGKLASGHNEIKYPPSFPEDPGSSDPCAIYNAMIAPLVPYTIKGFLWYQGEYEVIERACARAYYYKMHALVEGWRKIWGEELPFYYVQIAPWAHSGVYQNRPDIIDAQMKALDIPKTGIALTYDLVDDLGDIHPKKKRQLTERLSDLALKEVYGQEDLKPYSPIMEKVVLGSAEAKVYFSNVYDGLKTSDGNDPDLFKVAGPDGKFVDAVAEITGKNEVTLTSAELTEIKYVSYGRGLTDQPNLRNSEGLPASIFTTFDPRIKNLAYHQPVEAECYLDCDGYYLTDGLTNRHNGWESYKKNEGEAIVKMKEPKEADTVVLYPFSDGKDWQRFIVSVKGSDGEWKEVGKKDDYKATQEKYVYKFDRQEVSEIKLQCIQTLNWQRSRFNEIQLYDGYAE